jgi:hypothetical protein
MNNKMTWLATAFAAALLTTVATVPLKYAAAQNTAMPQTEERMTEGMIKAKLDQWKAEHPEFVPVLEKVQSMNATQTLRALVGTHVLERILEAHAMNILIQKVAGAMRNAIG